MNPRLSTWTNQRPALTRFCALLRYGTNSAACASGTNWPRRQFLGRRTIFVTTQYVNEADGCDTVAIVAKGEWVALGTGECVARALGGEAIDIIADQMTREHKTLLEAFPWVRSTESRGFDHLRVVVDDAQTRLPLIVQTLYDSQLDLDSVDIVDLKFDDVFVRLIEQHEKAKQG